MSGRGGGGGRWCSLPLYASQLSSLPLLSASSRSPSRVGCVPCSSALDRRESQLHPPVLCITFIARWPSFAHSRLGLLLHSAAMAALASSDEACITSYSHSPQDGSSLYSCVTEINSSFHVFIAYLVCLTQDSFHPSLTPTRV